MQSAKPRRRQSEGDRKCAPGLSDETEMKRWEPVVPKLAGTPQIRGALQNSLKGLAYGVR